MTYSVDSVVCDYGVYETINGNRKLCVICNSRANASLVADILNKDYEHEVVKMKEATPGEWLEHDWQSMREKGYYRCSVCHCAYQRFEYGVRKSDVPYIDGQSFKLQRRDNFCPNCGADMRGKT